MYADRYAKPRGLNPGGVAFALGASGILLFGLSLSAPNFIRDTTTHLIGIAIPLPPEPKPKDPPPPKQQQVKQVQTPLAEHVDVVKPILPVVPGGMIATKVDTPPVETVVVGTGTEIHTTPSPTHTPVFLDPQLDQRYIDNFQPNYPSDERLAGHEGRVVVRVLIGADGRVKDVQQISAATTAFFEATRKQALAKWRFKPGTRDGTPVEAWRTMAVRFVLDEQ